ncbi:transcriptional regulator [Hyphomicrobium methylovorum]|uniref:HVO_A0114 family putative DNA-binding protein n=1 Tax=Hyphomicrobium methylovorum TaxID=84 RepID=UPI0015E6EB08|nr:winged helix-turn-helix transcriptional regulator [Hyphomicrobium methylovorum]MBA2127415.1 transcriptional regulator [Hyphomicrobium methylovorum]
MTNLLIKIQSTEEWKRGALAALKAAQKGKTKAEHSVGFPTYSDMHETLAPSRLEIIKALAGQGPLAIREVARRVGRDVQAVHRDVTRLINAGVIERDEKGVRFDYDGLKFEFKVELAA